MIELPEVAACGDPVAYPKQDPAVLAGISERACPAGWDLHLAQIGGEPWGVCWQCGLGYRITGGVLMCVPVITPELNRLLADAWQDPLDARRGMPADTVIVDDQIQLLTPEKITARLYTEQVPRTSPQGDQWGWARRPGNHSYAEWEAGWNPPG